MKILISLLFSISLESFSERPYELYEDFLINNWNYILKYECPSLENNVCKTACVTIKTKNNYFEFNCYGITIKSNHKFYKNIVQKILFPNARRGKVCIDPFEEYVKVLYFEDYYLPIYNADKCYRPLLFNISVMSGLNRAIKVYTKHKDKGNKFKSYHLGLMKEEYLNYLKKLKHYETFKNGWNKRINNVYKNSLDMCDD